MLLGFQEYGLAYVSSQGTLDVAVTLPCPKIGRGTASGTRRSSHRSSPPTACSNRGISLRSFDMRKIIALLGATALAASPAFAAPGGGHGRGTMNRPTTTMSQPTNIGHGYDHLNSPRHTTGQPGVECEDVGTAPGRSASARGSAFNEDGIAHSKYAGEQPQNSRNTASVSQYDVGCH